MPKSKKKSLHDSTRELGFAAALTKLVNKHYPDADDMARDEIFRVLNWGVSKFSPEAPSVAQLVAPMLKRAMEELDKLGAPRPFPPTFIPGIPPRPPGE